MRDLDEIINESRDVREVKRAICVEMALSGKLHETITVQAVQKLSP